MAKKKHNFFSGKLLIILSALLICSGVYAYLKIKNDKDFLAQLELEKETKIFNEIRTNYNKYVLVTNDASLYKKENDSYIFIGSVLKDTKLILEEKEINSYLDDHFKLANSEYYIGYESITPTEEFKNDDYYKGYIPFNQNVVTKDVTKMYTDDGTGFLLKEGINLPLIIKDKDKYYFEFDNRLVYVNSSDATLEDSNNSNDTLASSIPVILYHYVYNDSDKHLCSNTVICHSIPQVSSHFDYLAKNNYYSLTMRDMDLWMDGKINLPKKSVVVTIDDGQFYTEMKTLLNNYKIHGTYFLIASLSSPDPYISEYSEVHSHTYKMHYTGACPGGQGSPIKCLSRDFILNDLKKSRELINNTTYFSWPFYEYNTYSYNLLKEAGFTMAFVGGMNKATRANDKLLIPRITIQYNTTLQEFISYVS